MENNQPVVASQPNPLNIGEFKPVSISESNESIFNSKNFLILFLLFILTLSLLGINLFVFIGNIFDNIMKILKPVLGESISIFNTSAGTLINTSADAIEDVTKLTGEVVSGSLQSVGDLLIKSGNERQTSVPITPLDIAVNTAGPTNIPDPTPNATTSPIQTTIPANKGKWCLVGEYKEQKGCVEMREHDKCMSGQVYPSQSICLNPTLSQNKIP
jgi:hypothetical protein